MIKKDSFITGFLAGLCLPIVAYAIIMIVFEQLDYFIPSSMIGIRPNTHALLAIASNIILIQIAKRRHWNNSIKGVVFVTLVLAGIWFYKYNYMINLY